MRYVQPMIKLIYLLRNDRFGQTPCPETKLKSRTITLRSCAHVI